MACAHLIVEVLPTRIVVVMVMRVVVMKPMEMVLSPRITKMSGAIARLLCFPKRLRMGTRVDGIFPECDIALFALSGCRSTLTSPTAVRIC